VEVAQLNRPRLGERATLEEHTAAAALARELGLLLAAQARLVSLLLRSSINESLNISR
jgi:hypothetical protein